MTSHLQRALILLASAAGIFFPASIAVAAAYAPAGVMLVPSRDGTALLRIDPGAEGYGSPGVGPYATATVLRLDTANGSYVPTHRFQLRNQVSPAVAAISDRGEYVLTCDDWADGVGCTENTVVIYRGDGSLVKAWRLEDLFTAIEIARFAFPRFANSSARHWRGPNVGFHGGTISLSARIPAKRDGSWQVDLDIDVRTLTVQKTPVRQSDR